MTPDSPRPVWRRPWPAPLLAALITLLAVLPGLFSLPPLDRDESRFAEASAQMLESRDFVTIHFQDEPRFKKPVGIYWLQSAAAAAVGDIEARRIWPYRLPSLLGAMLAAAACAWSAGGFFDRRAALLAGALLGVSLLLSTEGGIAKTDAVLCGVTTLSMAAMGRLYGAARGGPPVTWRGKLLFWLGLAVGILDKGPITPMVVFLGMIALAWADRGVSGWWKKLSWGWGLVLLCALILPWAFAITIATDGAFWSSSLGGDLAPKLAAGGQEGHAAWPGYHTLLVPLLFFPGTLLLPAGAVAAWRRRAEPGIKFALCWLLPAWLVFELTPTKLVHYPLPTYGALALLCAAGLPQAGRWTRRIGAGLGALFALILALAALYLCGAYASGGLSWVFAVLAALAYLAAGGIGGVLLLHRRDGRAMIAALSLAAVGHGLLLAGLGPRLSLLWISARADRALHAAGLNPRDGAAAGPVAVAGYAEPSLVFALGAKTQLTDGAGAADAVARGQPALVEAAQQAAFLAELARLGVTPRPAGEVDGRDYSSGDKVALTLYRGRMVSAAPAPVR